jgi:glycosyltransferase involved in cell wall biosynthesis
MGRGSERAYSELSGMIGAYPRLELVPLGIVPPRTISAWLAESDVLLFSRDEVSSRRGTAIAAVAHGLPVVGFEGTETGYPITEAGVALARPGNVNGLVDHILRIASEPGRAAQLRLKSRLAYETYFSWDRIAMSYEDALT